MSIFFFDQTVVVDSSYASQKYNSSYIQVINLYLVKIFFPLIFENKVLIILEPFTTK